MKTLKEVERLCATAARILPGERPPRPRQRYYRPRRHRWHRDSRILCRAEEVPPDTVSRVRTGDAGLRSGAMVIGPRGLSAGPPMLSGSGG